MFEPSFRHAPLAAVGELEAVVPTDVGEPVVSMSVI